MARPRIVGLRFAAAAFVLAAATIPAAAQDISVTFGSGTGLTERVLQLVALVTVLSLAPSILIMVTSFTRIVVVLSLLRTALGTATAAQRRHHLARAVPHRLRDGPGVPGRL